MTFQGFCKLCRNDHSAIGIVTLPYLGGIDRASYRTWVCLVHPWLQFFEGGGGCRGTLGGGGCYGWIFQKTRLYSSRDSQVFRKFFVKKNYTHGICNENTVLPLFFLWQSKKAVVFSSHCLNLLYGIPWT